MYLDVNIPQSIDSSAPCSWRAFFSFCNRENSSCSAFCTSKLILNEIFSSSTKDEVRPDLIVATDAVLRWDLPRGGESRSTGFISLLMGLLWSCSPFPSSTSISSCNLNGPTGSNSGVERTGARLEDDKSSSLRTMSSSSDTVVAIDSLGGNWAMKLLCSGERNESNASFMDTSEKVWAISPEVTGNIKERMKNIDAWALAKASRLSVASWRRDRLCDDTSSRSETGDFVHDLSTNSTAYNRSEPRDTRIRVVSSDPWTCARYPYHRAQLR